MKDIPPHIKPKPNWWKYIPWLCGAANTIYPHIYLPYALYIDLQNSAPNAYTLATLAHEEAHLARQKSVGILPYALRYIFQRTFRYQEELHAIAIQMRVLSGYGAVFDIDKRAKLLASWEYGWCTTYKQAEQDLTKILQNTPLKT